VLGTAHVRPTIARLMGVDSYEAMRYEVLGPLRVLDGGAPIDVGGPRQQRVLAVLLAATPDNVSVDRLIDEVWGETAPNTAAHVISTYVSNLRAVLGGRVESDGRRYRLSLDGDEIDASELDEALEAARTLIEIEPDLALRRLASVASLRRGRPFEGVADDSLVVQIKADELEERWLAATELRLDAELRTGDHASVVPELEALVGQYPLREHLAGQLMLALYRSQRQVEALAVYRKLRKQLVEELGLDPSPALQELEERILLQDPALDLQPPHNIPTPVSSFVGRATELGEVIENVERARLVTLIGVGGVGKTRLAREAAAAMLDRFADGVWWVDLAPIDDVAAVIPRAAEVLGVSAQPGFPIEEVLRRFLSRRTTLFVFDNCEHLAAGRPVGSVLAAGPGVKVLATSRQALQVGGEVRYPVPPMGLPDPGGDGSGASDAERLFRDRSSGVGLEPSDDWDAADIARICVRLDGIPLAIEMAAAHTRVLSPAQIAGNLEHDSASLLTSQEVDRTERHRTLDATIGWSYDLLEPHGRTVFDRLSVFAGSFDLAAAEAAAGFDPIEARDVLGAIGRLVDASMLTASRSDHVVRYRLLQTLREYSAQRLSTSGAADEVSRRHAHHYLAMLVEVGANRFTPPLAQLMTQLDAARDDLLVALDWLLEHEPQTAIEAAAGLAEYWSKRGDSALAYRYGRRMLEAAPDARDELRANGLLCASFGAALSGDFEFAGRGPSEAVELARSAGWQTRLWAFHALGNISLILGDLDTVETMGQEILELCRAEGLDLPSAYGSSLLGLVAFFRDRDLELAGRHLDDAIEGMRRLHDYEGMKVYGLVTAATAAADRGAYEAAERYATEAISIPGAAHWTAAAYITLAGYTLFPQGELERASRVLERGTRMSYEAGGEIWMRTGFLFLANLAAMKERWEPAARFYGACRPNLPGWARDPRWWTLEPTVQAKLGNAAYERLRDHGEGAPPEAAIEWIGDVTD